MAMLSEPGASSDDSEDSGDKLARAGAAGGDGLPDVFAAKSPAAYSGGGCGGESGGGAPAGGSEPRPAYRAVFSDSDSPGLSPTGFPDTSASASGLGPAADADVEISSEEDEDDELSDDAAGSAWSSNKAAEHLRPATNLPPPPNPAQLSSSPVVVAPTRLSSPLQPVAPAPGSGGGGGGGGAEVGSTAAAIATVTRSMERERQQQVAEAPAAGAATDAAADAGAGEEQSAPLPEVRQRLGGGLTSLRNTWQGRYLYPIQYIHIGSDRIGQLLVGLYHVRHLVCSYIHVSPFLLPRGGVALLGQKLTAIN